MMVEVDNEDERAVLTMMRDVLRRSRNQSLITFLRTDLLVRSWSNGQPSGHVSINNLLPAWREGLSAR